MKYSVVLKFYLFLFKILAAEVQDNDYIVQEFSTYKCHCGGQCPREDGLCPPDSQCDKGWFGFRCQFQDLLNTLDAKMTTQPKRLNVDWLSDGIDKTCNDNTNIKSITVKWLDQLSIPLSFFRIVVSDQGRNVAYKQSAMQSSNYTSFYKAAFANDGNTDANLLHNSCSHTDEETSPMWNLTLQSNYVINRVILYNRDNFNFVRLQEFVIQTFDSNLNVVEVYKDKTPVPQRIYHVNLKGNVDYPVNLVSISLEGRKKILTLCEVEAYGECPSGFWSLPCNKRCPPSCPDDCDRDNGACNTVCIGYSNPPKCDAACSNGHWGINCRNNCSNKCIENICDVRTGLCHQGCDGYNDQPYCKTDVYKFSLELVSFGIGCAACGGFCILVISALTMCKTIVCQCKRSSSLETVNAENIFEKKRNPYNEHNEISDDHFYEPVLNCRNNIEVNTIVAFRNDSNEYAEV